MRIKQKREGATMQTLRVGIVAILLQAAFAALSLPGCPETCGNISIPYPFGIGPDCFREGFNLTCSNFSNPPKLFLGDGTIQVLSISLPEGVVRINSNKLTFFERNETPLDVSYPPPVPWTGLMDNGPYTLSANRNRFIAIGCGLLAGIVDPRDSKFTCFCGSMCRDDRTDYGTDGGACSGISCCQTSISKGIKEFNVQLQYFDSNPPQWARGMAARAFLVEHNLYQFSPRDFWSSRLVWESRVIPAVLDWMINDTGSCENSKNMSSFACHSNNSECYSTNDTSGYLCKCSDGYQGNPYLSGGCTDNDECNDLNGCDATCLRHPGGYECLCPEGTHGVGVNFTNPDNNPLFFAANKIRCIPIKRFSTVSDNDECNDLNGCDAICLRHPGGYECLCPEGTHAVGVNFTNPDNNPLFFAANKIRCIPIKRSSTVSEILTGAGSGIGVLLLLLVIALLYGKLKTRRAKKLREIYFGQNKGLLLQQLISSNNDAAERVKIFTSEELEKATNNFDRTRILGHGGHGTVYKGILLDQRVVAIKKSNINVQSEIDQFINEVAILTQINHRNIVKLFGCCLETEVPLLVYEFISNGTLAQHLHASNGLSLSWDDRLRIALETARALAYLHTAASLSIFHRDVKSANILLDDALTAKISDFGASRSVPLDHTRITTAIHGTFGYLDPEYFQTSQLTDKSDVYSFGVILIELLSGQKAVSTNILPEGKNLATNFLCSMRENCHSEILEARVLEEGGEAELESFAKLAETCLRLKGEERPTMKEVEVRLEALRGLKKQSQHIRDAEYLADPPMPRQRSSSTGRLFSLDKEFLESVNFPR